MYEIVFILLSCVLLKVQTSNFNYGNQAKWYDDFSQCNFKHQSPIELSTDESILSCKLPYLYFHNYDYLYSKPVVVENNGHTANIELPKVALTSPMANLIASQLLPQIYGGPLGAARFYPESAHFHWGSKDNHGSEHVIDGVRHSMEMHIVHRNSKYATVEEAREYPDGLVVLAIIYQANETNEHYYPLDSVTEILTSVKGYNQTTEIKTFFNLENLISGFDHNTYFTYEGSLTTPPCSEAVTWIVFNDIVPISHKQIENFHELRDDQNVILENNYRALQPKGGRKVIIHEPNCVTAI